MIAQIGEIMNQLEKSLSKKYDKLPWVPARRMRNIIVHDDGGTGAESTIHDHLPSLKLAFLTIKNNLVCDAVLDADIELNHQ